MATQSDQEPQEFTRQRGQVVQEVDNTLEMLKTQTDRARLFGFGRRILVPPDEIHVVVGDGFHASTTSKKRQVYGTTADRPSSYWLNSLTQVIKLKTVSFNVQLQGQVNEGIEAFDSSKVSFRLWAHAVAKLNPDKAEVAAQRVGLDTTSLIHTINKVGTAELVAAAATMNLEEIIGNRQELAQRASQQVNKVLAELGYDLALLTITRLDGEAYRKLVEQAEARISKETSIVTNREQVAELEDRRARERREAEITAETEEKLATERLAAEEKVETSTLRQHETLDIQRHELKLREVERQKIAAQGEHETGMARIALLHQQAQAEAENKARLARLEAERQAELRAMEQERTAKIRLAETQTEAERLALEQVRQIERDAKRTEADAKRLEEEQLAAAERAKKVALVEANQLAEGMKVEAEAQAEALRMRTEAETRNERVRAEAQAEALRVKAQAETQAELIKAEAEATATEKRAQAAKIRAEALRAETAAPGLAEAEVAIAQVEVDEKKVAVTRAEGLAQAEVAQAQAAAEAERIQRLKEVEINTQRQLAELYDKAPILIELEKIRVELAHQERLATIRAETQLKIFEALAPSMQINIYGNGGQVSQIMTEMMSLSYGVNYLGQEVPLVGRWLNGTNGDGSTIFNQLGHFFPYFQQALAGLNPRMISSLKVSDLIERLSGVVAGREDLVSALGHLRQDGNFRLVGDLPLGPVLALLGLKLPEEKAILADAPLINSAPGLEALEGKIIPPGDGKTE